MHMQDHPAVLAAFEFVEDRKIECGTDQVYTSTGSIRPAQVAPLLVPCQDM
jgi:hypothetical protein